MKMQNNITVMEILSTYLDTAKVALKLSTVAVYHRYIESYIEPHFKDLPYSHLTSDKIQEFILNLTKSGLSAATVQTVYSFLKSGLSLNCRNGIFDVTLPKNTKQQVEYLSIEEQKQLENAARMMGHPLYLAIIIGLYSGIRIGELCGLMWCDIDFSNKIMRIRRTLQRIPIYNNDNAKTKIVISAPKSPASLRNIPIPLFMFELLLEYKKKVNSDYVLSLNGKYLEPRYIQNHFKKLLKAANIKNVNFHTVRHTFATRALESGFDIKSLSEILGHASATVTLDKYAHVLDGHKRNLMEKMADNYYQLDGCVLD